MEEIIEDLIDYGYEDQPTAQIIANETFENEAVSAPENKNDSDPSVAPRYAASRVVCIASRSSLDEAASAMLTDILEKRTIPAFVQPLESARTGKNFRVDVPDARLVCLSYFGAIAKPAHVRYQIRRIRRVLPKAKFLACFWMLGGEAAKLDEWKTAVGADFVATSLTQAAEICAQELPEVGGSTIHLLRSVGNA